MSNAWRGWCPYTVGEDVSASRTAFGANQVARPRRFAVDWAISQVVTTDDVMGEQKAEGDVDSFGFDVAYEGFWDREGVGGV